ncbi:FAD-dependent oxidoreductase [Propylenella binzhouense]|uniref:FAD-binding protein n=1 Tax=Propylenella binzhouense TaxID=2555902 RepID=A0A964T1F3_9HYPH|nr:FAD-binding protein [Propylenella binzhouense]MYZ46560.1 FAD-binding protein [Propylenella binzhouense]
MPNLEWDLEVDVLVAGAGGAGLAAAILAHDAGASVAITEKLPRPGGNTAISTGSVPGAGTRFQRAAGIEDDGARFERDLLALSGSHDADHLVHALAHRSAELVEWLVDDAGIRLDIITDYRHVGHSVPRLHAPSSRKGEDLTNDLLAAVSRRDIPLALSSPVVSLLQDENRIVVGAVTRSADGAELRIGFKKLILCVNGFGQASDLVRRHCPEIAEAMYVGARGSEGEAIRWGEELGARMGNMKSYQAYAAILHPHGELLSWTTIEKGGILVNEQGDRFGDEAIGYSGFAASVKAQKGPVTAIFDQAIYEIAAREPWFKEILDYGAVKPAGSVRELAVALEVDERRLGAAFETYNRAASGEIADPFGRTEFGVAPLKPTFWHARVVPALLSTQGGLMTDAEGRVLDRSGERIPNLFAAGGAVAGISGREGGIGYSSGSGLLHALGLGWIAARTATREIFSESR